MRCEDGMANGTGLILVVMCFATFMAILDTSLVNLGLKSIQQDLRADTAALQWVIDVYNLTYAVFILTGGTLGDLYGRRRVFVLGVAIFAVGTLVCAIAPSGGLLVLGRGVAGLGAAIELPVALAILNVTYPDAAERTRAIAIWGGMNGLAMAIGPTVGGILVDTFVWRSLFWAILPVAAITGALGIIRVPESSDPHGRGLDTAGQVLAIVTLAALCVGFIEGPKWGFATWRVVICFALFLIGLSAFLVVELRSPSPLVPLPIFRGRAFSASLADASLMTFGMYGLLFVLPLFLQTVKGEAATRAGIELLPMSATFFIVSLVAASIANAWGPRVLIPLGMILTGTRLLTFSSIDASSGYWPIAIALFAVGIGLGLITGPIATVAVANAPAVRSGMSSGLVNVGRMVGATLGVAFLGLMFGPRIEEAAKDAPRFMAGMSTSFLIGAAAQFLGAAIALTWLRRDSLQTKAQRGGSASEAALPQAQRR
jgi:MFS transporter, DHA2 family, methylenomycin A resistance protein